MAIEDIVERTTINFPRIVDVDYLAQFFSSICRDLGYEITYELKRSISVGSRYSGKKTGGAKNLAASVSGIIYARDSSNSARFSCIKSPRTHVVFSAIKFDTIPGYEIEEHDYREVQIWDNVRMYATRYFARERKSA